MDAPAASKDGAEAAVSLCGDVATIRPSPRCRSPGARGLLTAGSETSWGALCAPSPLLGVCQRDKSPPRPPNPCVRQRHLAEEGVVSPRVPARAVLRHRYVLRILPSSRPGTKGWPGGGLEHQGLGAALGVSSSLHPKNSPAPQKLPCTGTAGSCREKEAGAKIPSPS